MFAKFIQDIPLFGIFIITFFVVLLAVIGGMLLGKKHRLVYEQEDRSPIGSIVAATLGLLAFLLAFTFGIAASQYNERRELVVDEANAIGTTYLRAEYLADPYRMQIKNLLEEYVSTRLDALEPGMLAVGLLRSEELQDQIWQQAVAVAKKTPNSVVTGLFIQSLNEVIDLHAKRIHKGLHIRMPLIIWIALYFVAVLAVGSLGYQFGLTHTRFMGITLLLILTFSSVIALIADLDRPQEGFVKVSQQSLIDLKSKFNKND